MSKLHEISDDDSAARKADVLFVHGLGGDAFRTWRHGEDESSSWPHWLADEFPEAGVWSLGYAASPTRWERALRLIGRGTRDSGQGMSLPDRARQVLDLMVQKELGERPLMFICHSLGGLLVKQLLRRASDATDPRARRIADQTRSVLFLATPHSGASLASLANTFRVVFGTTVSVKDLKAHDAHLRDLFDWYRNHSVTLSIETVTYHELRNLKGALPIVNPASAHPGVGADPIGLDEDHLSIAKPREREAQVCGAARHLLDVGLLAKRSSGPSIPTDRKAEARATSDVPLAAGSDAAPFASATHRPSRRPREMPPAAHRFFGRGTELAQLVNRLRAGSSTAVVGPAGFGKTALAAAALESVLGPNATDLSGSPFPDGVIYLDLYALRGRTESAWNALANRIRGPEFMERWAPRERATEACRSLRVLLVIEGGEEADGSDDRGTVSELLGVLSSGSRWLLLTRINTQAAAVETVSLGETLQPDKAAALLDSLVANRSLDPGTRRDVLDLLEGHPLAITWAGNLLARDDEDPAELTAEWACGGLPKLRDPRQAGRTLRWLFERSVRGTDDSTRQVLAAAGLLALAPFSLELVAVEARSENTDVADETRTTDALKTLVQRGLMRRQEGSQWQFTHALAYRFSRDRELPNSELPQRVADRLHDTLVTELNAGEISNGSEMVRYLQHAKALLEADEERSLWDPLARGLLYAVADRLEDIGRLDLVASALESVAIWLDRLPLHEAERSVWRTERCVLVVDLGDLLLAQGDLDAALTNYREALAVREALAEADPSNSSWRRDLSASQNKVGDVLRAQGDLDAALTNYREALVVREALVKANPSNSSWRHDLSVSQNKVGDVLRAQGDLDAALTSYREALAVAEALAKADPSNMQWLRDLSYSLTVVAQLHEQRGDNAAGLPLAERSLRLDERLASLDLTNATWQKDVAVSRALVARLR